MGHTTLDTVAILRMSPSGLPQYTQVAVAALVLATASVLEATVLDKAVALAAGATVVQLETAGQEAYLLCL
jgi:hypothetical protein